MNSRVYVLIIKHDMQTHEDFSVLAKIPGDRSLLAIKHFLF